MDLTKVLWGLDGELGDPRSSAVAWPNATRLGLKVRCSYWTVSGVGVVSYAPSQVPQAKVTVVPGVSPFSAAVKLEPTMPFSGLKERGGRVEGSTVGLAGDSCVAGVSAGEAGAQAEAQATKATAMKARSRRDEVIRILHLLAVETPEGRSYAEGSQGNRGIDRTAACRPSRPPVAPGAIGADAPATS